ncbi:response regulator [Bradyrhizobium sp.]|jgi:two-component system OmpR family response regulator|uniref:response regulator n=1 Tax=Bradyrhizobium sp. TaxID=376 RepID=UPI00391D3041
MMSAHNTAVAADANIPAAARILCVEDDREIAALLTELLQEHGFAPRFVASAAAMNDVLQREQVDLIMLDLMLPDEDGMSICRRLRQVSTVPIIMVTAKGEDIDRILGLELGADDYVVKPFNPRELVARIRALLRRSQLHPAVIAARQAPMTFDGWRIEPATRTLFDPDRVKITLTSAEFDILLAFCRNAGRVLSREQLIELAHGGQAGPVERSIDVHISRIRQKIEPGAKSWSLIKTVRLGGYVFTPRVETIDEA